MRDEAQRYWEEKGPRAEAQGRGEGIQPAVLCGSASLREGCGIERSLSPG